MGTITPLAPLLPPLRVGARQGRARAIGRPAAGRRAVTGLAIAVAALAALASAVGLLAPAVYRDKVLVTAAFRGNDLVTLAVAVPLLTIALALDRRGSLRARLVVLGMFGYALYNYAFYLFGAAFNPLFLVYVALLVLSIAGLVVGLRAIDPGAVRQRFAPTTPARPVAGFLVGFAGLLAALWIARVVGFLVTGEVPADITATGHPTAVVYALDLTLLVPALLVAAALLWRRRAWGFVLATALLVKATTYGVALIAMSPFADAAGVAGAWQLVPLWAVLGAGCAIALVAMFRGLRGGEAP